MYAGRFAPSPTGALHFGSLVAALASWLDARAAGGRWLVRIEDLDPPREQPGASAGILRTLAELGLSWDGEIEYQSKRRSRYEAALRRLTGFTYPCGCSRKEIADSSVGIASDGSRIYPGTCRPGLAGKPARALRVIAAEQAIEFADRVQGPQSQRVDREVGDFVLLRADGQFAYQLAVVVDDAEQGITDVVRGADLIDSTARQIHLQRLLGYAQPRYLHVPAAVNASGEKLSKQTGASPVDSGDAGILPRALRFLGQPESDNLRDATRDWDPGRIPRKRSIIVR
jgi:glutamyl-Q tRNA(Asp) synthetase